MKEHTGTLRHCNECDRYTNAEEPKPFGWRTTWIETKDPKTHKSTWKVMHLCENCNPQARAKPTIQAKTIIPRIGAREVKRRAKAKGGLFD